MASKEYALLPVAEEDKLHGERLLNIDQKVFQRITKRLLSSDSLLLRKPPLLPTPPPDASELDEAAATKHAADVAIAEQRQQWREDMLLDFALLESNMVRIQLLRNSNEQERERYAAEKIKILETAQRIRDNNTNLRQKLEEAQLTLALRKEYDVLADKILSNRMLRPREDQHAQLEKLEAEIAELDKESDVYAQTWRERQDQFGRIVQAGKEMLMLIRDEKEEAERKEGMEMDDADDAGKDSSSVKGAISAVGSPHPSDLEGGATPRPDGQGEDGVAGGTSTHLKPRHFTRNRSRAASPSATPATDGTPRETESKDVEMEEVGAEQPGEESEIEEGEHQEDEEEGEEGEEEGEDSTQRMEISR